LNQGSSRRLEIPRFPWARASFADHNSVFCRLLGEISIGGKLVPNVGLGNFYPFQEFPRKVSPCSFFRVEPGSFGVTFCWDQPFLSKAFLGNMDNLGEFQGPPFWGNSLGPPSLANSFQRPCLGIEAPFEGNPVQIGSPGYQEISPPVGGPNKPWIRSLPVLSLAASGLPFRARILVFLSTVKLTILYPHWCPLVVPGKKVIPGPGILCPLS